jgi:aryl-alcohol dehydrogenase
MKITGAVARGPNSISLEELELGEPRPDEVLVRIDSSGICSTDLEVLGGHLPLVPYPVVLGHEGAGSPGPADPIYVFRA